MNNLPDLPKQNKKFEADFGVELKAWIEKNSPETCSIEIKHTHGKDSMPFSAVEDPQIAYANRIRGDKGAWIRTLGQNGEPDYVWLKNEPAFFFIKYPKGIVAITVGNFLFEKERSKRKSLVWDRAVEIATKVITHT